ncbi:MAG: hypothetical protein ABJO02_13010 [Reichenbachiella sp.]|uniref:hypothetical protein n=1 Tax=Reichenbachiella sp. TaxID=2184521 RepID=UPI00329780E4
MNKKDRHELYERYLKNQLDGIALRKFEQELESNELMQRELTLEIELREALSQHSDYSIFKDLVEKAESEYFQKPNRKSWPLGWAAALLALLISTFVWKTQFDLSPDDFFEKNFVPYKAPGLLRGDVTVLDEDLMIGLIRYDERRYVEAIEAFESVIKKDSLNYTAQFLCGVSHMALQNFKNAESILIEQSENQDNIYKDQSHLYLMILYQSDSLTTNDEHVQYHYRQITDPQVKAMADDLR